MDKDMNILSSTMEFVEQCKVTHPDDYHSHDIDPAVICKTSVESQVVEAAETLGVITENDRMETENKNRSTINHSSSADDTASIDGPCDNLVNASACSRDSKAVGNMMTYDTDGLASVLSSSCRRLPSLASVAKTKNPIEVSDYSGSELILSFISDPFGFAFKWKSNGQVLFI
ncbi:hypothetical protein ACFX2J_025505 [Malus domestica]